MFGRCIRTLIVALFCVAGVACNDGTTTGAVSPSAQMAASVDVISGCQGPDDCDTDELCVVDPMDPSRAACKQRCTMAGAKTCPTGTHCGRVIGASADHAAACLRGHTEQRAAWERCDTQTACTDGQRCVYLDETLGTRCVPLCETASDCAGQGETCTLHWRDREGASSGCVQRCMADADCGAGWTCVRDASIRGICVR